MINIPVLRWGEAYESLDTDEVFHHRTGEVLAKVGQANPGLLARARCCARFPSRIWWR